ncbi:hypothetical protein GF415_00910 [Candidatus Micrarchaeota archaeon]|nr:hypothetical protein [Candidatus Micrarchaeota archaeon]
MNHPNGDSSAENPLGKKRREFLAFLEKYRNSKLVVSSHANMDLDALCTVYAMKSLLPNAVMALPDKMEAPAEAFAEKMGMELVKLEELDPAEYEGLVLLDCSTSVLFEEGKKWDIKLIVDHHHKSENNIDAEITIRDDAAPSAAEMLGELLPEISPEVAYALGVAIISDTARFKNGRGHTFEVLAKMISISGKGYRRMLDDAEPEMGAEYKIAVLEGFRKVKISVHGGYVVATTVVPSHESLISSSISEFADVVFAAKWKNEINETRISSRARKQVPVRLNEVMKELAEEFGGGGGGHAKAAGCSAKARPAETLDKCIEIFSRKV